MKIAVCQIKTLPGNLAENYKKISDLCISYSQQDIDVITFPELSLTGYFAKDIFLKNSFINSVEEYIEEFLSFSSNLDILIALPCPLRIEGINRILPKLHKLDIYDEKNSNHINGLLDQNRLLNSSSAKLVNSVIFIRKGQLLGISAKKYLPNFDIFDEVRYFIPGNSKVIATYLGDESERNHLTKLGFPICRDLWTSDVCQNLKSDGAEILISINASPFSKGKFEQRLEIVKSRYNELKLPIIYCNQIIGHDGIVFDGRSFAYDNGKIIHISPAFQEAVSVYEFKDQKLSILSEDILAPKSPIITSINNSKLTSFDNASYTLSTLAEIYGAMVAGTRDYVLDNGFKNVIIGISGGVDSALVAAICCDAIGSENVIGVMLPSKFSSSSSKNDAIELSENLQMELLEISITDLCDSMANTLRISFDWENADIVMQNIQSRLRGSILMALTNASSSDTGNKFIENLEVVRSYSNRLLIEPIYSKEFLGKSKMSTAEYTGIFEESNQDLTTKLQLEIELDKKSNRSSSNIGPALLMTTGNKSEYAAGYATIYGDMNGGFNPIKDVYKTQIFDLARWRNQFESDRSSEKLGLQLEGCELISSSREIIPTSIIEKAPSAELTNNQKDTDSLPDYQLLDGILEMYIDQDLSFDEIIQKYPADIVSKVISLVKNAEFKRIQSAPGVRISTKSFNLDRRYPITTKFK